MEQEEANEADVTDSSEEGVTVQEEEEAQLWWLQAIPNAVNNTYRPPYEYTSFDLNVDTIPPEQFRRDTRFTKEQFDAIWPLLRLEELQIRYRLRCSPRNIFYIVCCRLAYPQRLYEHTRRIGRSAG